MTTIAPPRSSRPGHKPGRGLRAASPAPLSTRDQIIQAVLVMVAVVVAGLLANLVGLSQLQHVIAQQNLRASFTESLAAGTAPVSEGDYNNVLLADGTPVAQLRIPEIGLDETVVEGTSSGVLTQGVGHRRDTVLPGQAGVSVLFGRANAYGGPFGRIGRLPAGTTFSVITGQGEQTFRVLDVRYAGEPSPSPVTAGQSRLVLVSAKGAPYMPVGVVRVDAELISPVQAACARQTTENLLPTAQRELGIDTSTVWALLFALQFLVVAEIGAVWSWRRFGGARTWVVFVPILLLSGLLVADQLTRLLPNLI